VSEDAASREPVDLARVGQRGVAILGIRRLSRGGMGYPSAERYRIALPVALLSVGRLLHALEGGASKTLSF
jgi:hypothetical protein